MAPCCRCLGNMPGREGQPVYYGVRPDHLTVVNTGGFEAIVEVVEPTGADTLVFASIGKEKICGRSRSAMVSGLGNASPSRHASTVCICSMRNQGLI